MPEARWVITLLGVVALTALPRAHAVEVEPCAAAYEAAMTAQPGPAGVVYGTLAEQIESGCILGATDSTGIRQLYLDLRSTTSDEDRAAKRAALFDRVLAQFDGLPSSSCGDDSTVCIVGRHVLNIRDVRQLLSAGSPDLRNPKLSNSQWTVVIANGTIPVSSVQLQPYLARECATGMLTPQCRAAVDVSAKLMRSTFATFQGISVYAQPIIDANAQFLSIRDKEWNSYFNEVSVQYPWELAVNSWWFQKQTPANERGQFPRAPQRKLIALHPAPGFEYSEAVNGERSTQAAVVVELIGYERWRWREGKPVHRVGLSLAAAFSDVVGADSVGYGVVIHMPIRNASIGAVWRDGNAGDSINLIFSMDLAKLIQQYKSADVKDFIKPPTP